MGDVFRTFQGFFCADYFEVIFTLRQLLKLWDEDQVKHGISVTERGILVTERGILVTLQ